MPTITLSLMNWSARFGMAPFVVAVSRTRFGPTASADQPPTAR